jgi:hypothetical protein
MTALIQAVRDALAHAAGYLLEHAPSIGTNPAFIFLSSHFSVKSISSNNAIPELHRDL